MDALKLLKKDHDEVKKMLKDLEATTDRAVKTRQDLFGRLRFSLTVHEQMEEAVLYPALKEHEETREIALEAYEEHDVVDTILGELEHDPLHVAVVAPDAATAGVVVPEEDIEQEHPAAG